MKTCRSEGETTSRAQIISALLSIKSICKTNVPYCETCMLYSAEEECCALKKTPKSWKMDTTSRIFK